MSTVNVRLVIDRKDFEDLNFLTGLVWAKKGDVQPVPVETWQLMKRHTDIWAEVPAQDPAKGVELHELLKTATDDKLQAFSGKTTHASYHQKGDGLRAAVATKLTKG